MEATMLSEKTKIGLKLFTPQRKHPDPKHTIPEKDKDLHGKVIVFTGGTNGIGRVSVNMLYKMGATVIVLGRNKSSEQELRGELTGDGKMIFELCDLASLDSVKACAEKIRDEHKVINVLVNCAGANQIDVKLTVDGFDQNWAINYFAPYLLTTILQDNITERIVNVTTDTGYIDRLDINNMYGNFATASRYADSKLSLNMFSIDLAERLKSRGVTVNYLLPGYIKSSLLRNLKGSQKIVQLLMNIMASPTEVGADRVVRLAISSEYGGKTGVYVSEDVIKEAHNEAQNADLRRQVAEITEKTLAKWLS